MSGRWLGADCACAFEMQANRYAVSANKKMSANRRRLSRTRNIGVTFPGAATGAMNDERGVMNDELRGLIHQLSSCSSCRVHHPSLPQVLYERVADGSGARRLRPRFVFMRRL